jgi:hypothetical protein
LHLRGHIGPLGGDEQAAEPVRLLIEKAEGRGLLLLVGVEDRGNALGVGGERLDAGALDLQ